MQKHLGSDLLSASTRQPTTLLPRESEMPAMASCSSLLPSLSPPPPAEASRIELSFRHFFQFSSRAGPIGTTHSNCTKLVAATATSHRLPRRRLWSGRARCVSGTDVPADTTKQRDYEFSDNGAEVELRFNIGRLGVEQSKDVFVDVDDTSLLIRVKSDGINLVLMDVSRFFERIKSSETIWFIDEDQLVVNLKKWETELKWPDIMESWETLASGVPQLLKGTSIYVIGDSTEINQAVAKELAIGIGYVPLSTSELLEQYAQRSVDSWVAEEGAESVAAAESAVLESLSSHVRTVVATLGGPQGAASRFDQWQHIHSGYSVWLSVSNAFDEASAKEEARKNVIAGTVAYTKADVVVKLGGWDAEHVQLVAQGCLNALKQLTLADKQLSGKKNLYLRMGCRGDWPDIKPPGWDPATGVDPSSNP